eukprot:682892-Rhodomonas_salina.1
MLEHSSFSFSNSQDPFPLLLFHHHPPSSLPPPLPPPSSALSSPPSLFPHHPAFSSSFLAPKQHANVSPLSSSLHTFLSASASAGVHSAKMSAGLSIASFNAPHSFSAW